MECILQPVMSVEDATVYGVTVGKMEGRAGMAAIVLKPNVDEEVSPSFSFLYSLSSDF